MSTGRLRQAVALATVTLLAVLALVLGPFLGSLSIPWDVLTGDATRSQSTIFWQVRVPQVLTAFLAGMGLSAGGMAFQAMFRNPLATPFTLGVASGASLGAAIFVRSGLAFGLPGVPGITLFAFGGALGAIGIVYGVTRARRDWSTATLLLCGVAISFLCSSLLLFVQYISRAGHSIQILHWLMGGLNVYGYDAVLNLLPFVVTGVAVIWSLTNELNLLAVGEDIAASRGVTVQRIRALLFFVTSLTVAGVVAVCGPIGFVGMMVPHIGRLLVGANHRLLAPLAILGGGFFLVFCDRLARVAIPPADLPVGIVTAMLGGPFFLWLLIRRGIGP